MVRRIISGALGVAALVIMLSASPALADKGGKKVSAPEFDIAAAGAVAAIVAGGGVLLARRRRN